MKDKGKRATRWIAGLLTFISGIVLTLLATEETRQAVQQAGGTSLVAGLAMTATFLIGALASRYLAWLINPDLDPK